METREYERAVERTAPSDSDLTPYLLGLAGETGEILDYLKKVQYHEHPYSRLRLIEELGDLYWYFTMLRVRLGISLTEVQQYNVDKLRKRYPDGFDPERSRNREH